MNLEKNLIHDTGDISVDQIKNTGLSGRLPLSVSIETECGLVTKVAEIGDVLPVKKVIVFSMGSDIADAAAIRFYAGERPFAKDSVLIGECMLDGIKKLPYGRPVITLNIEIETFGSINIEITDEGSLKNIQYIIPAEWVPTADDIVNIVKDAQDNLAADSEKQNKYRMFQHARESLCRSEAEYNSLKKKLSMSQSVAYKRKINRLKSRLKKVNPDEMTELMEKAIIDAVNALNNAPGKK